MPSTDVASSERVAHEIEHGRYLAESGAVDMWGWGSPAGRIRARNRVDRILDGAQVKADDRVLEIGCGTGMFSRMFAETGARVVAVDVSPDLIALARERSDASLGIEFVCDRFESAALDGPYDAVIGSSVLHHLEVRESLRRILDVLKPGGWMAFAEPNILNPQVYTERRFRHWKMFHYVSPDEVAFSRFRLRGELRELGFDSIRITPFDFLHPSTPRIGIPIVGGTGRLLERVPVVRELAGSLLILARRPIDPGPRSA